MVVKFEVSGAEELVAKVEKASWHLSEALDLLRQVEGEHELGVRPVIRPEKPGGSREAHGQRLPGRP